MKTYFRLLSFARPINRYAIPYIICTIFSVIFSTLNLALVAPLLTTLFDENTQQVISPMPSSYFDVFAVFKHYTSYTKVMYGPMATLKFVCVTIVISVLLSNIFRYFADRIMESLRIHTLLNLRKSVFDSVMDMHLGYFSNERKGDILSKVASDVQVVQYSVTGTLQVLFKEPVTIIAYLVFLFIISYKLTLASMLIIPIAGFLISKIVRKLKEQAMASHVAYGMMISYLDEALHGIKIIKAFNAVKFITNRFHRQNVHYSKIIRSMSKKQQMASPVSETLGVIMVAGIVLFGGSLVLEHKGDMDAASFIAYIALFSQVMRPAKAISASFSGIHSGIAAGERVLEMIDMKCQINDAPDATALTEFKEAIRFENVTFAYEQKEVLRNISFTVPKGKTIALVGPSGGGKSTLMDLVPRFIDVKSGNILIDGKDIRSVTMESLRTLMGIVNQESILFNDSIFNNIAFGNLNATAEEVEAAARIANAHEFILNTTDGYATNIGDKGSKLSGGQRQRICIARAVLANPPIMLLDEATSALDTESEKMVQEALNNLMKNRTSLVIAHRLSTIQNADQIIVLDNGQIAEQGTHQELLNANGIYRKLIEMQTFSSNETVPSEVIG
ncbi:ABC transporter ATP-binding protein [Chitinophaga nivalis]|uniref:ABC transporter ATP-binding protein/permease n=1 Tax=Chitinophaga nivalis TaxID=2991709 RepID=A0ABT3IHW0_9BACT|nr:ABC transporter ATP-binding protein [Chitinophaga nivalis]MCW3466761.1 ABC transporter ATP-binding protein/permease [Chitinophaga nivalis]MCW3483548.1 ABC transporter ATP-binding protein/permease [Chitinophaga nivalis]